MGNELIELISAETGQLTGEIDTGISTAGTFDAAWSADGHFIGLGIGGSAAVWDVSNKTLAYQANGSRYSVVRVMWRHELLLWLETGGPVRFWQTGAARPELSFGPKRVVALDLSTDANLLALTGDALFVYDLAASRMKAQTTDGSFGAISWSPTGNLLAATKDIANASNQVFIFSPTLQQMKILTVAQLKDAAGVSWSPDGSRLLVKERVTGRLATVNPSTGKVSVLPITTSPFSTLTQ